MQSEKNKSEKPSWVRKANSTHAAIARRMEISRISRAYLVRCVRAPNTVPTKVASEKLKWIYEIVQYKPRAPHFIHQMRQMRTLAVDFTPQSLILSSLFCAFSLIVIAHLSVSFCLWMCRAHIISAQYNSIGFQNNHHRRRRRGCRLCRSCRCRHRRSYIHTSTQIDACWSWCASCLFITV